MQQQVKTPGAMMLLVVGILYVIFSGFGIIGSFVLIAGDALLTELSGIIGGSLMLIGIIALITSAFGLVAGISGIVLRNKPGKGKVLFTIGVILVAAAIVSILFAADGLGVLSLVELVLPVLFLIGAMQKMNHEKLNP